MAAEERLFESGSAEYIEPDPSMLVTKLGAQKIGRSALVGTDENQLRTRRIDADTVTLEPRQDIRRYPPIQVQLPRDVEYVDEYVNMGPTDWSKILHNFEA